MYLPTCPRSLQRGLEAILGPSEDPLQGSLEAVILLAAHAFRLELTISVAALYHFEEFLTFAEAQPIFTQTLLDQQFNVDTFLLDISTVIPRLIRSRKVWPRLQHTLLQVASLRDAIIAGQMLAVQLCQCSRAPLFLCCRSTLNQLELLHQR